MDNNISGREKKQKKINTKRHLNTCLWWVFVFAVSIALMLIAELAVVSYYKGTYTVDSDLPTAYKFLSVTIVMTLLAIGMIIKKIADLDYKFLKIQKAKPALILKLACINIITWIVMLVFVSKHGYIIPTFADIFSGNFSSGIFEYTLGLRMSYISYTNLISKLILIPIATEIIFRGVLYDGLKDMCSVKGAMIISSMLVAFASVAFLDLGIDSFIVMFVTGLIYAYCYEKTKTLWYPIFLHAINPLFELGTVGLSYTYVFFIGGLLLIISIVILLIMYLKERKTNE